MRTLKHLVSDRLKMAVVLDSKITDDPMGITPARTPQQAARSPLHIGPHRLEAALSVPRTPRGLVIFAHGSGSNRLSPRNRAVAEVLHEHRLATLLLDLLEPQEAVDRHNVFDIALLAERVTEALDWQRSHSGLERLPVGLFGASTGAAAALVAAAMRPAQVAAVVSRGGRPDLAGDWLPRVVAPTLLIIGGADREVLALNRRAMLQLGCEKRLEVVPGATHLFEEPGALDTVAHLAGTWFADHFGGGARSPS